MQLASRTEEELLTRCVSWVLLLIHLHLFEHGGISLSRYYVISLYPFPWRQTRVLYKEYYKRVMDSQTRSGQCTSSIWKQLDTDEMERGSLVSR